MALQGIDVKSVERINFKGLTCVWDLGPTNARSVNHDNARNFAAI